MEQRNTSHIGNVCQAKVLSALIEANERVLLPFGDGCYYDLLLDREGTFHRVQCKSGRLRRGAVRFKTSTVLRNGKHRAYGRTVEYFGVYCSDIGKSYLVPIAVCGTSETSLRVERARNNAVKGQNVAEKFEIKRVSFSG